MSMKEDLILIIDEIKNEIKFFESDLIGAKILLNKAKNQNEINSLIDYAKCQEVVKTYPKLLEKLNEQLNDTEKLLEQYIETDE